MSDPDLYEWLALRRIHRGGIAKSAGTYLDYGRPTPGHLIEVFDRLIWTELVTVADGNALWDPRRVSLTDAGQARYAALSEQRPSELVVLPPEFGITQTPVGRRSEPLPPVPGDRSGPPECSHDLRGVARTTCGCLREGLPTWRWPRSATLSVL
ncbi:MAG: hypothetical protein ACRDTT_26345 [Pseudonocardiaceae bacterium]